MSVVGVPPKRQTRQEYPDHLNPFDEKYGAVVEVEPPAGRGSKYNTWGATSRDRVKVNGTSPARDTKTWVAAIVTPPKSKLVRRLSLLKNTVGRLSFRRPRRNSMSAADAPHQSPPGSGSPGGEFAFTIVSPKIKQRIRQQVFRTPVNENAVERQEEEADSPDPCTERLTPQPATADAESREPPPTSPQPPPRTKPKLRKKKPPPPPPPRANPTITVTDSAESPKSESSPDSQSVSSSITRELERDALSEAEAEVEVESEPDYSIPLFITETETDTTVKTKTAKD